MSYEQPEADVAALGGSERGVVSVEGVRVKAEVMLEVYGAPWSRLLTGEERVRIRTEAYVAAWRALDDAIDAMDRLFLQQAAKDGVA